MIPLPLLHCDGHSGDHFLLPSASPQSRTKMSLRDLATTACDPGSSSSNPLTNFANTLLPNTAQAHALAQAQQQQLQQQQFNDGLSHEEAVLRRLEAPLPPPHVPPPQERLVHTFVKQHPWQTQHPPIPQPQPGAATDVFERAFRTAGKRHVVPAPYRPISTMRPAHFVYTPGVNDVMRQMEGMNLMAQPYVQERSDRGAQREVRDAEDVADAQSWGDEFTSFENSDVGAVELDKIDLYDRFIFDDTVEGAFQQWLRRDDMEQYRYAQREHDATKTAEESLEEGIKHREAGRLTKAIECFEDALNRREGEGLSKTRRATAWYLLGVTHAETDDDTRAIQALRQGLSEWSGNAVGERRGDNPYVWQSLIALSVSYTNELELGRALLHMKEWFELWEERESVEPEAGIVGGVSKGEIEGANALEERLNVAATRNPKDVDLFIVLGILHNLNREYSTATDAFRHAVMLRPDDSSLWNKLGATLANGGSSDDALRAYRKAVDINPCLIRAWVNVGTAYANRNEFAKATRYYLKAISMAEEQAEKGERMGHVWGYLRTSLISLQRPDILHLVDEKDVQAFRTHFSF